MWPLKRLPRQPRRISIDARHWRPAPPSTSACRYLRCRRGRAPTLAMTLYKLRLSAADLEAGEAAAALLSEFATPGALAVTLFESGPASFLVEAYYDAQPSLADMKA